MKKLAAIVQALFVLALFSFLVAPTFAAGGFGVGNNLTGFWQKKTSVSAVITITFTDNEDATGNLTTYTSGSLNSGTATSDRISIAGLSCSSGTAGTPRSLSSATINGVSADIISGGTNSGQRDSTYIVAAINPTGTTAVVSFTWSGQCGRASVVLWSMTGRSTTTAFDTATDFNGTSSDPSTTIDIPANGGAVAFAQQGAAITSATWTGLTERTDTQNESVNTFSSASDNFASAQTGLTVTCNFASNGVSSMAVASWGP